MLNQATKALRRLAVLAAICSALLAGGIAAAAEKGPAPTTIDFNLAGDQEAPTAVITDATGTGQVVVDSVAMTVTISVTHNVQDATAAHIHGFADVGTSTGVIFSFVDPASPIEVTWDTPTADDIQNILDGLTYVNVHTAENPAGEIRGQIVEGGVTIDLEVIDFPLDSGQESDSVSSTESGNGQVIVNLTTNVVSVSVTHTVANPTAAHIHGPAPAGEDAGVVFGLGDGASPITAVWDDPTADDIADILDGMAYVNIHTSAYPAGEIRGQIVEGGPSDGLSCLAASSSSLVPVGLAGDLSLFALVAAVLLFARMRRRRGVGSAG